jgi:hypothetical protein
MTEGFVIPALQACCGRTNKKRADGIIHKTRRHARRIGYRTVSAAREYEAGQAGTEKPVC